MYGIPSLGGTCAEAGTPTLDRKDLDAAFEAGYLDYNAGTFAGSVETINKSMEKYFDELIEKDGLALDPECTGHTCGVKFSYLLGNVTTLKLIGHSKKCKFQRAQRAFSTAAESVLNDLLESRNDHVHQDFLYPVLGNFEALMIPVGNNLQAEHVLIFNPTSSNLHLVLDHSPTSLPVQVADSAALAVLRTRRNESFDFEECPMTLADIIVESLTPTQFACQHPGAQLPTIESRVYHIVVIYYGRRIFYIPVPKRVTEYLRSCFLYEKNGTWKTHCYRFRGHQLMDRIYRHRAATQQTNGVMTIGAGTSTSPFAPAQPAPFPAPAPQPPQHPPILPFAYTFGGPQLGSLQLIAPAATPSGVNWGPTMGMQNPTGA